MPPISKLNEQVIQMTYKVKREERDCQRLVCIAFPVHAARSPPAPSGIVCRETLQDTYSK